MEDYQIQLLCPAQKIALSKFYKRNQYKGKLKETDRVWVMAQPGKVVGAARFCQQAGCRVLRGVWIERELRSRGLGHQLLHHLQCKGELDDCYCFPYLHLETFYSRYGFKKVKSAPAVLKSTLERYNRKNAQVLLMLQQA
ncbi:GNAT family N-acetyltransferase [Neptunomonas japonica]|uniref:GCN5 family acetyltransferase n=1 Tax=Neptunomonas japonica JAMM 1380 TaxID=1441457 RepID=A0A7R6PKZ8_9GAMM|nr:GNAT family N-acetyltransferase [Neptunomonas japonica]BBB31041.1 GCN5 family acetyltransferase [Neptunomonas japonica JAMM 1380]